MSWATSASRISMCVTSELGLTEELRCDGWNVVLQSRAAATSRQQGHDDVSRAPTVLTPSPASLLPSAPHATPRLSVPCSRAPSRWHRQPGRTPPLAKQRRRRGLARRTGGEGYPTSSATARPRRRRCRDSPGSPAPGSGSSRSGGSAAAGKRYQSPTRQGTRQWTPPQPQVRWRCPGSRRIFVVSLCVLIDGVSNSRAGHSSRIEAAGGNQHEQQRVSGSGRHGPEHAAPPGGPGMCRAQQDGRGARADGGAAEGDQRRGRQDEARRHAAGERLQPPAGVVVELHVGHGHEPPPRHDVAVCHGGRGPGTRVRARAGGRR
jgi:hypothetical protein